VTAIALMKIKAITSLHHRQGAIALMTIKAIAVLKFIQQDDSDRTFKGQRERYFKP
jgi:hypothetical protein